MSPHPTSDPSWLLQPVAGLAPRPIDWLWPHRLALGKLTILDGDPGLGKSLLTLDLCARLSTGRPFPGCTTRLAPAGAIVLNGEDGAADTLRPRLLALGATLACVFLLHRHPDSPRGPLRLPTHLDILDAALAQTGARLVVIDPIMNFLDPRVLPSCDQSVRQALYPLAQLAEKYRCAILLVRHLNKTASFQALYRGGGSIGIVGACRAAWLVARDPHDPQRRILSQVKNNLAGPQPALAFRVDAAGAAPPTITWLGPSPLTADQLLAAAAAAPKGLSALERSRDFLTTTLAAGPRTSRDIWPRAQEQRLARRTLRRAKQDLHIRSVRVWADGQRLSYWLLPGQQLPATIPPDASPPDLEPWLAPLRDHYPPSTPLDDL